MNLAKWKREYLDYLDGLNNWKLWREYHRATWDFTNKSVYKYKQCERALELRMLQDGFMNH